MALAKDRNTPEQVGDLAEYPVLAATTIYAGALVVLDADGYAKPGTAATGLIAVGRAEARVVNAGASGAETVRVKRGVYRFANSAGADEITAAQVGDACYVVDDETVAKVGTGRSVAGLIEGVDAQGVWVRIGFGPLIGAGLLAANNLSDVGTKATARSNLGVYEMLGTPTFTIGSEAGNAINVAVQLTDSAGADLAVRGSVFAYLTTDANGDAIAGTAPSGGVAIGTDGLLIPLVAGKAFQLVSEADGDIDITITEAGTATWRLVLVMPDGRLAVSGAITFA